MFEDTKSLEARLTRVEAALAQLQAQAPGGGATFTPPGGAVVDPAPWPGGGWGGWGGWNPWHPGWPHPIVDPAAFAARRPGGGAVVDPAPSPFRQTATAEAFRGIGHIGDPPPIDVSRFSIAQLEATLHSINAEKARLSSMETMIKQQLTTLQRENEG